MKNIRADILNEMPKKKYKINCISLILILLSVFTEGYTEENREKHFNIGAGWSQIGLRDRGISPLYYSGSHANLVSGFHIRTNGKMHKLETNFSYGNTTPSIYPDFSDSKMKSLKAGISYEQIRFAGNLFNSRGKWHAGGLLIARFAYYEHNKLMNSARNNYFLSTLNVTSSISRNTSINSRKYRFALQIYVPLAAVTVRPSNAFIRPSGFLDHSTGKFRSVYDSMEFSSFNRFTGAGSEISVEYNTKKNNILRFAYNWEFFSHNNSNPLKSATHGITFKTMFNF